MALKDRDSINNSLNNLNINKDISRIGLYCNCWGFVAYMYGFINEPTWLADYQMEKFLEAHTRRGKHVKGAIAVYRNKRGELLHTAIVDDVKTLSIIHKPGSWALEVSTLKELAVTHGRHYRELKEFRVLKER